MHREISHADTTFTQEPRLELRALLVLLAGLVVADLWPAWVDWLGAWGLGLPTWPREIFGQRFALVAAVLGGARTLYGALESLLQGRVGADLAVAIAVLAAILLQEPLVAAEVLIIGLIGELLEDWTFRRTQSALGGLVVLTPKRCWRLKEDGTEERVLVTELRVGDRVVVRPGAKLPVDGWVISGSSTLDTSALTGESVPAEVGPGSLVLAGSLNHLGSLTIEARSVAEHTVAGQVAELTARALSGKSAIERHADRLARWFLPVVLVLAVVTFLGAYWLESQAATKRAELPPGAWQIARRAAPSALAVLVVACPCALILATPAAIIAALGRLAGTGILLRQGATLERIASVRAFCLDKTGTLTEGRPGLVRLEPLSMTAEELLGLAAGVESGSEHPLGRALVRAAEARGLAPVAVKDQQASPGGGVTGLAGGRQVAAGSARYMKELGIDVTVARSGLEAAEAAGETPVLLAVDGVLAGYMGLLDRARPEAARVIAELRQLGMEKILMLTGDRPAVALRIAGEVGLAEEEVFAGLLPADKAAKVAELESGANSLPCAMLGDGINDAPALARAAAGLAVSQRGFGVDLAAEAGDAVLLGAPLEHLGLLVRLSRRTNEVIGQNILWFALGANLLGVVVTAWLWPLFAPAGWKTQSPLAAAIYHQVASVLVLASSMRLLWFERPAPSFIRSLTEAGDRAGGWIEKFSPGELLHEASHHLGKLFWVSAVAAFLVWCTSGWHAIQQQQQGRVLRFGRLLEGGLQPGFHWRWPWPLERVERVADGQVRTVTVGFRPGSKPTVALPASGGRTWASAHAAEGILRQQEESLMITGDGYLVEMLATVRYRVSASDPFRAIFELAEPDRLVRYAAETVLRELAAESPFSDLLTAKRGALEDKARDRLAARLDKDLHGEAGLDIDGVSLHDLHPPLEVVASYHEVTRAMEGRQQRQNQAQATGLRKRGEQVARDEDALAKAFVDGFNRMEMARATGAAFLARLAARGTAPTLVDFRLFWDTVGGALTGREKVLVDSPGVPMRSNLWLIPPDMFRPAAVGQRTDELERNANLGRRDP